MNRVSSIPECEYQNQPHCIGRIADNHPFVIRSGMRHWAAYSRWSLEYLCERYGRIEYDCQLALPTGVPTLHLTKDFTKRMCLQEFVDTLRVSTFSRPCYLHQRPLRQFPGLEADLSFEEFTGPLGDDPFINLWIGSAGTKSSLHFDFQNGLLAQVAGTKRFFMVDPSHSSRLASIPGVIQKSRVDPENPDFEAFPSFADVPILVSDIGPGDVIYIPSGWWHAVRGMENSISVNCFFGPHMGAVRRLQYVFAAGFVTWIAVIRDFFKHGVMGANLPGRLYSSEPFGVWFYNEIVGYLRRRRLLPTKP
jgi:hypothetical protein